MPRLVHNESSTSRRQRPFKPEGAKLEHPSGQQLRTQISGFRQSAVKPREIQIVGECLQWLVRILAERYDVSP